MSVVSSGANWGVAKSLWSSAGPRTCAVPHEIVDVGSQPRFVGALPSACCQGTVTVSGDHTHTVSIGETGRDYSAHRTTTVTQPKCAFGNVPHSYDNGPMCCLFFNKKQSDCPRLQKTFTQMPPAVPRFTGWAACRSHTISSLIVSNFPMLHLYIWLQKQVAFFNSTFFNVGHTSVVSMGGTAMKHSSRSVLVADWTYWGNITRIRVNVQKFQLFTWVRWLCIHIA